MELGEKFKLRIKVFFRSLIMGGLFLEVDKGFY